MPDDTNQSRPKKPTVISALAARSATSTGRVLIVLVGSIVLALVAMALVLTRFYSQ